MSASTKQRAVQYDQKKMSAAFSRLEAAEIKSSNIFSVHGYVPAAVEREPAEAEAEYGLWRALWKDDRTDPYL